MWFWVNLISLYTFSIAISIKQKKKKQLNEAIIVSNKEVFDYRYRDSTNGKSIINFMINKDKQGKAQTGKENISITDTEELRIQVLHWCLPHHLRALRYIKHTISPEPLYTINTQRTWKIEQTDPSHSQSCPDET